MPTSAVSASLVRFPRVAGSAAMIALVLAATGAPVAHAQTALTVDSGTTTISDAQSYVSTSVATNSGDTATLTVTTTGTLINSGNLIAGINGRGTLNVSGGRVTNAIGFLGQVAGSAGTATVSSGTWANSINLVVGSSGTGVLNVTGGVVTNATAYVGNAGGSVGIATVSSGTWANSADVYLGRYGRAALAVTGGMVSNANSFIGNEFGGSGTATVSGGTWATSGDLTVGRNGGSGTLAMTGGLVSVGGTLSVGSAGTINLNAGGSLQIGTGTNNGVLGVSSLANNGTLIFNRSDASTYSGVVTGSGAVTKQGAGTLTLAGANSYSGATTVAAGKLLANGVLSTSAVTVNGGAVIGGSGTIGGLLTVQSGGTLAPGNSPGILTVGTLDLQAGSTTQIEIVGSGSNAGTAGVNFDQVFVTTAAAPGYGGLLDLVFGNSTTFANGTTFDLFEFSGSPTRSFASVSSSGSGSYAGLTFLATAGLWTSSAAGQTISFSEATGILSFSAPSGVPEIDPAGIGSVVALLTGMLGLVERRRTRRRG